MFTSLKLHERLLKSLEKLALSTPTAIQEKTIPVAMQGKDIFLTAPTGTGKTLAFVLPLLHRLLEKGKPGKGIQALIVLPTRELALQIYKTITQVARYTFFESLIVTGGETLKEQAAKLRKNPDIVIGTPGRLIEHVNKQQLILDNLQILILDETDRILDMGFGDDVTQLIERCPPNRQTLLLSATKGDSNLHHLISTLLSDPIEIHLNDTIAHTNIQQYYIFTDDNAHKERVTQWLLAHETYQKAIIFTNTRQQADTLSQTLMATQIEHVVLHSDKAAEERKQIINTVKEKKRIILIATDVAARGLDISNLDLVINFDLPNTKDEYVHRIGRTGRMDNQGLAISLVTKLDQKLFTQLKETMTPKEIKSLKAKFQGFSLHTDNFTKNLVTKRKADEKIKKQPTTRKKTTSSIVSEDGFAPLKRKK